MQRISEPEKVDAALAGKRVMALFQSSWCPYCRAFEPHFDRLAGAHPRFDAIEVMLEDDDNPLWERFRIELVPTVLFFENGSVARRLDGRPGVGLRPQDLAAVLDHP